MKQLFTVWGENFDTENVLPEYPRPQMVRDSYINLNGYWEYAIEKIGARDVQEKIPNIMDGKILVPFSPECALSGVGRQLQPDEYLWYQRTFYYEPRGQRVLLHFGAVDQAATLYINHKAAATHVGGYLPFDCDVTRFLRPGDNTITLRVTDGTDETFHSRGKQKLSRGGMFYTAQSGIWQTVWAEIVPQNYITRIELNGEDNPYMLRGCVHTRNQSGCDVELSVYEPQIYASLEDRPKKVLETHVVKSDEEFLIPVDHPALWTTEEPYLYYLDISICDDMGNEDKVQSYFAMRSFQLVHEEHETFPRIGLNHKVIYQQGVLDQGYWPESLLTPPTDEAIIWDLTEMKKTGFNMVRKHIKIEPDRWYYHCDRLGLIVWQDMVNGGGKLKQWFVTYAATPLSLKRVKVSDKMYPLFARTDKEGQLEFKNEMLATIRLLKNHPSICTWVIFNEGWGQFHTTRMTMLAKKADPTRLIDQASGWFDQRGGDFFSVHNYFFELVVTPEKHRANVLSEIGGMVYKIKEHSCSDPIYGYSVYNNREDLNIAYEKIQNKLRGLIPKGLCASVYTQWTDVEDETNGVYTYDRKVRKIDGGKL